MISRRSVLDLSALSADPDTQHRYSVLAHTEPHKVTKYEYIQYIIDLEYHSVCPLVGIGTPPPLFRKRVCFPPIPKRGVGGVNIRLRVRGWKSPNSDD